jgi:hypothetical protein
VVCRRDGGLLLLGSRRALWRPPPFLHVPPRALWLECGPVEKKKGPTPSWQRATWLSACRRRAKRPSSSTRQANEVGRMSRRASRIWYWFAQSRASRAGAWSTRFHCIRQQARCCIAIFNNGSTTEPNGVSELGLAPHRATVLTTKHSSAERRERERESETMPSSTVHPLSLPSTGPPIWRYENFRAEMLFTSSIPTHTQKNGTLRALFAWK